MKQATKYLVIVLAFVAFFFSSCAGSRTVTKTTKRGKTTKTVTKTYRNTPVYVTGRYSSGCYGGRVITRGYVGGVPQSNGVYISDRNHPLIGTVDQRAYGPQGHHR